MVFFNSLIADFRDRIFSSSKTSHMTIRTATINDTERIDVVHKASIASLCSGCYDDRDIAGWLDILSPDIYENAIHEKVMIVAESDNEIIGLGILDLASKEIGAIYVHPKAKGLGFGKQLLWELEARASENNIDLLTLCSTVNAHGFYKHHGYSGEDTTFHELPNGVRLKCFRMHKLLNKQNL
ncbi:MAG: GNAT family N-acetyltransferase [Deltaproteobacteria bacterium]|nr:GNAT family N-acetyltransferase [Deltaproteobacteria bacterium]